MKSIENMSSPIKEYNEDGFLVHCKGWGGEFWNEYDYERKMVHFISSTGWDEWHYGWPIK